jgi:hypothetical protein
MVKFKTLIVHIIYFDIMKYPLDKCHYIQFYLIQWHLIEYDLVECHVIKCQPDELPD